MAKTRVLERERDELRAEVDRLNAILARLRAGLYALLEDLEQAAVNAVAKPSDD